MRHRSSTETSGSITVFLSFLLLFMMSFIFTVLEGARITASRAQLAMLSEMASDSFRAEYYYPLFKEYGLLGVDGGFGTKERDAGRIEKELGDHLSYTYENTTNSLLEGTDVKVALSSASYMLEDNKSDIRQQIDAEALFEGAELLMEEITGNEMFKSLNVLQELYEKQAEAMESAAAVTAELLRLMTIVDGISTTETGLYADDDGNFVIEGNFLKCFGLKDEAYMKGTYGNPRIYNEAKGHIVYVNNTVELAKSLIKSIKSLDESISRQNSVTAGLRNDLRQVNYRISDLTELKELAFMDEEELEEALGEDEDRLKELEKLIKEDEKQEETDNLEKRYAAMKVKVQKLREELALVKGQIKSLKSDLKEAEDEAFEIMYSIDIEEGVLSSLENQRAETAAEAESVCSLISNILSLALENTEKALACVLELRVKQELAKETVGEYEKFLKENEGIPGRIIDGLVADTVNLKAYVSLEKSGYDTAGMMKTLQENLLYLGSALTSLKKTADIRNMDVALTLTSGFLDRMGYESLKFNYTGLSTGQNTGKNVKESLSEALAGGLLDYLGVRDVSKKELNGLELPSKGEWEREDDDIFSAFTKLKDMFSAKDPAALFKEAGEKLTSDFLTEVWLSGHFSDYTSPGTDTRLSYEREYVLSGKKTDVENLASTALKLTALRAVFTMTSILADPNRNSEATYMAASVAGFTGIPALLYVVKYAIITVWALEEALVEVSALLMGKKVPLYSPTGRIAIYEIATMTKEKVRIKAGSIQQGSAGVNYIQYITLLSFFTGLEKKELKIADIIQENIRLKYRDTFRMGNVVTRWSFNASVTTTQKFDTGFFNKLAYFLSLGIEGSY